MSVLLRTNFLITIASLTHKDTSVQAVCHSPSLSLFPPSCPLFAGQSAILGPTASSLLHLTTMASKDVEHQEHYVYSIHEATKLSILSEFIVLICSIVSHT